MRVDAAARAERSSMGHELRDGWRAFRSRTWLWASVAGFMAGNALGFSPMQVLGPEVARRSLGGPAAWAAISTASGIGAVLGGSVGMRWRPRFPLRAIFAWSLVGTPALLALLADAAPLAALVTAAVVSGATLTLLNLTWFTVVQREIPRDELSRVSSWDTLGSYAINPVGLAVAGPVAVTVGIAATLYAAAAFFVLITLIVLAVPSVRDLAIRTPDQHAPTPPP